MSVTEVHGALGLDKLKNRTFQIFKVRQNRILYSKSEIYLYNYWLYMISSRRAQRKVKAWTKAWSGWATLCKTRSRHLQKIQQMMLSRYFQTFPTVIYISMYIKFILVWEKEKQLCVLFPLFELLPVCTVCCWSFWCMGEYRATYCRTLENKSTGGGRFWRGWLLRGTWGPCWGRPPLTRSPPMRLASSRSSGLKLRTTFDWRKRRSKIHDQIHPMIWTVDSL